MRTALARSLPTLPSLVVALCAAVCGCGAARPLEPSPTSSSVDTRASPEQPKAASAERDEPPLPSACEIARDKITLATRLGAEGFTLRANRLLARASELCPEKQSEARALEAHNRESTRAAAARVGKTERELWEASRAARAAGDVARARRLASLATLDSERQGRTVSLWTGVAALSALAITHDARRLLGVAPDGTLVIVDAQRLEPTVFLDAAEPVSQRFPRLSGRESARFSPNGDRVAISHGSDVVVYDTASGKRGQKLAWADHEIHSFAFSADGSSVIAGLRGGLDSVIRRFDVQTGDSQAEYPLARVRGIDALAVSPAANVIAYGAANGAIELLNASQLTRLRAIRAPDSQASPIALAFSPKGDRLACILSQRSLEVWDTRTGKSIAKATVESSWGGSFLGFSADGTRVRVRSGTWGEALTEIDVATGRALSSRKLPRGHLILSPGSDAVLSSGQGSLSVVDASSGDVRAEASHRPRRIEDLALADGHLAIARELREDRSSRVEIVVIGARSPLARFFSVDGYKATLALSRRGQRLAGSFGGKSFAAWEVESGRALTLPEGPEWVDALAFSGVDSVRAAGGAFELHLFTESFGATEFTPLFRVERSRGSQGMALSAARAVAITDDDQLTLFDLAAGTRSELGRYPDLRSMALSGDSRTLVVISPRGTERIVLSGAKQRSVLSSRCKDGPARVSADGSTVLVRCSYREIALFSKGPTQTLSRDVDQLELSPDGEVAVLEHNGELTLVGRDLKTRVELELGAKPGTLIARGPSWELERFGAELDGGDRFFCRVGNRAAPIELCEDARYRDHLVADALR